MVRAIRVVLIVACAVASWTAWAADWPQFLGPEANGIAPDTGINKDWQAKPPAELWRMELSDDGYAGPSVAGGFLFIIDRKGNQDVVRAMDLNTGNQAWAYAYDDPGGANYGYARSTPVFSEGRLYTLSRNALLHCLDAETGEVIWAIDLRTEFGGQKPTWDYAISPLIDGEKIIVCPGGQTGCAALNKETGETIWTGGNGGPPGYATPVAAELGGLRQYVIFAGKELYGVDAETGRSLWRVPWETEYDVNAATPIVADGYVFITSGYNRGCALIQVTGDGAEIFWENKEISAHFNSSIFYKGFIFGTGDPGNLVCLTPSTGKAVWKKGGFEKGGIVCVDDAIIAVNGSGGDVVMVAADPSGYNELGRIKPLSGQHWTAPIVADGKLIVRNKQALVCLDLM